MLWYSNGTDNNIMIVFWLFYWYLLYALLGDKPLCNDPADSWKHCLIMDEVDGMAGNEDRGGIQVL